MASSKTSSGVAKLEGKRSQSSIGNTRETLKTFEEYSALRGIGQEVKKAEDIIEVKEYLAAVQKRLDKYWKKSK